MEYCKKSLILEESIPSRTALGNSTRDCNVKDGIKLQEEFGNFPKLHKLYIIWIPGHYGIESNTKADKLFKKDRTLGATNLEYSKPFCKTKAELSQGARNPDGDKTEQIIGLSRT